MHVCIYILGAGTKAMTTWLPRFFLFFELFLDSLEVATLEQEVRCGFRRTFG
jgi:hypothetical protein